MGVGESKVNDNFELPSDTRTGSSVSRGVRFEKVEDRSPEVKKTCGLSGRGRMVQVSGVHICMVYTVLYWTVELDRLPLVRFHLLP